MSVADSYKMIRCGRWPRNFFFFQVWHLSFLHHVGVDMLTPTVATAAQKAAVLRRRPTKGRERETYWGDAHASVMTSSVQTKRGAGSFGCTFGWWSHPPFTARKEFVDVAKVFKLCLISFWVLKP